SNTRDNSEDQSPYASQEALDWLAGIAYQAKLLQAAADEIMWAIIRHRDNHKNVIGRNVLDQASETICTCLHLYQMLEDTIDSNES
ncbi:hypothetical protein P6U21_29655, partial [Bacillus paranthracis]|uniref:hypothetical protein n=1 Tax=Bacillus paranthracis TaxID=2026186 RepID=UPI00240824B6